jgi:stage V sporulation protein G
MRVTDVQVRLSEDQSSKLKAFCRITFDDAIVIHDIKVIEGHSGTFVAMPSRRVTGRCSGCGGKNVVGAKFCNDCGKRLPRPDPGERGPGRLHTDVVHPINAESRETLEQVILREFEAAKKRAADEGHGGAEGFDAGQG